MAGPASRKRWPILATAVVVVVGGVGASTIFLVGSAQRRDDRAAYLRYERSALIPIQDGGRLTEQEMKPSIRELRDGDISETVALERARTWRGVFENVRARLSELHSPPFLGDITHRWSVAIDGYLVIATRFEDAARADGAERTRLLTEATDAGNTADELFDEAARIMQFHRRRLGLGGTHSLPDPAATES
jgi:hypothetical protein